MSISTIIASLPTQPRKQVLKSFIGSLNSSIIGYVRGHIRNSRYENVSRAPTEPTIDTFNEALSEQLEAAHDVQALKDMGLDTVMPAIEVAHKLEAVRCWAIEELTSLATHPADVPLTIKNTIEFQIKREPDINEPALKALAQAIQIDLGALKATKVKMHQDDRDELIDMQGQIIDTVSDLDIEGIDVEDAIDSLPVHLRYKLMATLATSIKKAGDKALQSLLRYNRLESAGDITMIKATHAEVYAAIQELANKEAVSLGEYQDRGGRLVEVLPMS